MSEKDDSQTQVVTSPQETIQKDSESERTQDFQGVLENEKNDPIKTDQRLSFTSFGGPLPPPELLQHYKAIQPDLVERIMRLTEDEAEHRRAMDIKVVEGSFNKTKRGQILGAVLAVVAMGVAVVALVLDHPGAAGIIGVTTVVGLAGVFAIGRYMGDSRKDKDGAKNPEDPDE